MILKSVYSQKFVSDRVQKQNFARVIFLCLPYGADSREYEFRSDASKLYVNFCEMFSSVFSNC